jgi:two-component system chemotaxis response regulator CheB
MPGHDIIVVGASAGGVEALSQLVQALPADIPAAIFIVMHVPAQTPSLMPDILGRAGRLSAFHPEDGDRVEYGRIYVAPPDNHLLVERGYVRVVRGPRENRYRPAIDPLFRSAAVAYGPRVVGVILTGSLDDGTHGMGVVKRCGGISVIQDPNEALYPSMPRSVLQNVKVDYKLPLDEIGPLLVRLSGESVAEEGAYTVSDDLDLKIEAEIAERRMNTVELFKSIEKIGQRSTFTCPDCKGALWELYDGDLLRFRCHVGHAFSAESLVAGQTEKVEDALWIALSSLEEKVILAKRMSERARERNLNRAASTFEERAQTAEAHAETIRRVLLSGRSMGDILELKEAT